MSKIYSIEKIAELVSGKVVQCHGVIDLFHDGHLEYLQYAKSLGNCLVVTVTSDRHVNKGENRPIIHDKQRANILAALECVDYVAINDYSDASEAIKILRPDFYVKHEEYKNTECSEFETIRLMGAELIFCNTRKSSTTEIIQKCKLV